MTDTDSGRKTFAMKPGIPWSVKGIDQEAREAAKDAARRSGMTLGEWLNMLIKEQSEESDIPDPRFRAPSKVAPAPAPTTQPRRAADDIASKLDMLAEQLTSLTRQGSETAAARFVPHAVHAAVETQSLAELVDRVERNEREAAALIGDLVDRLERLERLGVELAERPQVELPQRPEDVPGYVALEGAMRNIISHVETSETRTRDTLKSLQDRLANLAARADKAEAERASGSDPAIAELEQRVGDLAERLAQSEHSQRNAFESRLDREVETLSDRIEALARSGENLSRDARAAALDAARSETAGVEARLQASASEAQRQAAAALEAAREVERLHGAIESLEQRFDDIKADTASERDLSSVKLSLEQLAATVAQASSQRPLAELDRRIGELARRMDDPTPPSQVVAHLDELESRIHRLDARLKELATSGGNAVTLSTFNAEIRMVGDRLSSFERQLARIATLDNSIAQLQQGLDENRAEARSIAETAARDAAGRIMGSGHAGAEPSPEIVALRDGLHAVKATAENADRRTQETLEAVHETLEHIISRLADMEARDTEAPAARPEAMTLRSTHGPRLREPPPASRTFTVPTSFTREEPEAEDAEADFDPGPVPDMPGSPDRSDADADHGAALETEPEREDFIAAARRAAQAGGRSGSPILNGLSSLSQRFSAPESEARAASGRKSRFSLPFLRRRREAEAAAPVEQSVPARNEPAEPAARSGTRRRLILAGLVLLAAVAAFAASRGYLGGVTPAPKASQSVAGPKFADLSHSIVAPRVSGVKQDPTPMQQPVRVAMSDPLATASLLPSRSARLTADRLDQDGVGAKSDADAQPGLSAPLPASTRQPAELPPAEVGAESLRQAALAGDPNAQFIVASRYLDGRSVAQDLARAADWFGRAAEQGLAPAQYRLAMLYERGRGVEQDREAAKAWYLRAAGKGNVKSMHNLAVLYAHAEQATPQYDLAVRWFRAAAERGLKDSQYNLAVLNERGMGTTADMGEAYLWFMLASKQGDADAGRRGQALEADIPLSQLAALKQRLDEWAAIPPVRAANLVAMVDPAWQMTGAQRAAMPADEAQATQVSATQSLESKDLIRRAQELLQDRGFDVGVADGVMGARTANAVRLFQLQNGLTVNGTVSSELLRALETPRS